ncbi:type VI secretion system protein TssR domain-containing protein [Saccharicrinis aurantiacus]|uniref:type VI secretion system protein TssR domain-containing protein n=1 Tax=Saccharicrinis aurantiacus TaxID=1849719 RepID=UPI0024937149|nr:type VI secretion system protein TssR domain-containing protein [Saccharicrinis aurantiacus]
MKNIKIYIVCILGYLITSCGPINMFTRIRKVPVSYTYNYCVDGLKAPKSILNKKEWIVYSDRDKNYTTVSAGGKLKIKDLEYLEPLLVIGKKRDYLSVIKYDPEIIDNGRLTNRKQVEYYGWIHKSKLLLNNQSITDLRTGLKNKSILSISNPHVVKNAELFFENDSVKSYMSPGLYNVSGFTKPNDIIYILKRATDKSKVLISRTPYILPDNIKENVLGWVSSDLIQGIGQQLFLDDNALKNEKDIHTSSIVYKPIISRKDSAIFRTGSLFPIINRSDNCIFNVNGNIISYNEKAIIETELKRINVVFLIEPNKRTIEQLPALINSFQNMNPLFADKSFSYQFASVVTSYESDRLCTTEVPFSSSFNEVIANFVKLTKDNSLKPVPSHKSWSGLETCLDLIAQEKTATNIIVTFGETGRPNTWDDSIIAAKASKYNCRFIAYQIYSGNENEYNNFVTQFTDLINHSSELLSKNKRELIVYSDQITKSNDFVSSSKNTYHLDFPKRSMTQGGICFPEKGQIILLDQVTSFMDSILTEVKADNIGLIESIDKAFTTVGNSKDKYEKRFINNFSLSENYKIERNFKESFQNTYPYWYKSYSDTLCADSVYQYKLLLSELEVDNLRSIYDGIADLNVDTKIIGKAKRTKGKGKAYCDCPGEYRDDFVSLNDTSEVLRTKYKSTRKTRKAFKMNLLEGLYNCPFCKTKPSEKPNKLTLAELHELIFHAPSYSNELQSVTVKSITRRKFFSRKRLLSDEDFEALLEFYKEQKSTLDIEINESISITSSGETYYWVDSEWFQ